MKTIASCLFASLLLTALTGCPQRTAATAGQAPVSASSPAQAAPDVVHQRPAPRMSTPMPPQVLPPQASSSQPVTINYACQTDSDCAIKDVGSCCGAKPECVNKDSPADPAGVRAQCAKEHRVSSCAVRNITQCGCEQHQCAPKDAAPVSGLD